MLVAFHKGVFLFITTFFLLSAFCMLNEENPAGRVFILQITDFNSEKSKNQNTTVVRMQKNKQKETVPSMITKLQMLTTSHKYYILA